MHVKFWGCRSSIPVPGKSTLIYGGNTNCFEISLQDQSFIILNAGSGIRNLGKQIVRVQSVQDIYLLLMHSNWDMLLGFPFFLPAYNAFYKIHIRGGPIAKQTLKSYIKHEMEPPFFYADFNNKMKAEIDFSSGMPIIKNIGSSEIIPIPLNHPNGGYGFKIDAEGKTLVFLLNNEIDFEHKSGKPYPDYVRFCQGADIVFHDAYYTREEYNYNKGNGHSTYSDAVKLAIDAKVHNLGLCCYHPDHSDSVIDKMIEVCREEILRRNSQVQVFGCMEGSEIDI